MWNAQQDVVVRPLYVGFLNISIITYLNISIISIISALTCCFTIRNHEKPNNDQPTNDISYSVHCNICTSCMHSNIQTEKWQVCCCCYYYYRTFAAAGARLWNSLPVQLRNPDISYGRFRWQLKGHLFGNDEHGTLWPLICSAIEKRFTYLLTATIIILLLLLIIIIKRRLIMISSYGYGVKA